MSYIALVLALLAHHFACSFVSTALTETMPWVRPWPPPSACQVHASGTLPA